MIGTKFCSQIGCKLNTMFESHANWLDKFQFSIWRLLINLQLKIIIYCVTEQTKHNVIAKICPTFQVLSSHFCEVKMLLYEHWAKNCVIRKYFNSTLYPIRVIPMWKYVLTQGLQLRILVHLVSVWPWYSTWAIRKWQPCNAAELHRIFLSIVSRYDKSYTVDGWEFIHFFSIDTNSWLIYIHWYIKLRLCF